MNNDTYVECMVKKKASAGMTVLKGALIALTVIMAFLSFMFGIIFLIAAVVFGVLAYITGLNGNLEYEYLYVDRELSVDKIMAQTRRKRIETFDLNRMEILAPIKSWHLDEYKNRTLKEVDYSTKVEEQPDKRYVMIYNGEKKIIIEPNAAMVKAIQTIAPRKVFTD